MGLRVFGNNQLTHLSNAVTPDVGENKTALFISKVNKVSHTTAALKFFGPRFGNHSTGTIYPRDDLPGQKHELQNNDLHASRINNANLKGLAIKNNDFFSELSATLNNRNKTLPENKSTERASPKILEELDFLRKQYALDAPRRAQAEAKEDARIAKAVEAEKKLMQAEKNAKPALFITAARLDEKGIPLPPPLPLPKSTSSQVVSKKAANKNIELAASATRNKDLISELTLFFNKGKDEKLLAKNKLTIASPKFIEEMAASRKQYELDAPKRALAEKKEEARVADALRAEEKKSLEINTPKMAPMIADLKLNDKGIPLPPPFPGT